MASAKGMRSFSILRFDFLVALASTDNSSHQENNSTRLYVLPAEARKAGTSSLLSAFLKCRHLRLATNSELRVLGDVPRAETKSRRQDRSEVELRRLDQLNIVFDRIEVVINRVLEEIVLLLPG